MKRMERVEQIVAYSIGVFLFAMFWLPYVMLLIGSFMKGDK